jgi:tRNA(Ile)-lysidine synthase TilS/MesJ
MKKPLSFRQLQKKLDRIFSEFIRLRDADKNGYVRCITCGKVYFWRDIDNGHYCERARFSTRFNEQNCHGQCKNCNWTHEGQKMIYREKLVELYGAQEVKKLETISQISGGDDSISLMYKIEEYQQKVKALKKIKVINRP